MLGLPHHVKKYPSYRNVILQAKTGFLLDFQGPGKTGKTSNPDLMADNRIKIFVNLANLRHKNQAA